MNRNKFGLFFIVLIILIVFCSISFADGFSEQSLIDDLSYSEGSSLETDIQSSSEDFSLDLPEQLSDFAWRLTDGNLNSRISFEENAGFCIHVRESLYALMFQWFMAPVSDVQIDCCDESGNIISSETVCGKYENLLLIPDKTERVDIHSIGSFSVSEILSVNKGEADAYIPWTIPDKADCLAVFTHPGDETIYFGQLLPFYSIDKDMIVQTVYLSSKNRQQMQETLNVLKMYQIYSQPVFYSNRYMFLENEYANKADILWNFKQNVASLTESLRRYKPEIAVSFSEEADEGFHAFTGRVFAEACACAGNKAYSGDAGYECWDIKKTFALNQKGDYSLPVSEINETNGSSDAGNTNEAVLLLYDTLKLFNISVSDTNPSFSLIQSNIGTEDEKRNDLFENIDLSVLTLKNTPAEESNTVPEDQKEETTENEIEEIVSESVVQTSEEEPAELEEQTVSRTDRISIYLLKGIVFVAGLLLSSVAAFLLIGKINRRFFWICVLPALICLLISVFFTGRKNAKNNSFASETTGPAVTAETPTTQDIPDIDSVVSEKDQEVDFVPDLEITHIGSQENDFFRKADEDPEVIVSDFEKGIWEYRSDTLSVMVDRRDLTDQHNKPVVYYVAHIRMRDVDAFRPGYGDYTQDGHARSKPWEIARRYKAVLAITGDNLIQSGKTKKGILIRDGILFWKSREKVDTLAMCDDFSMKIYPAGNKAETLLDDGIQNTYGFGPVLVRDSAVNSATAKHPLKNKNPRTGIGMIEPGHYVAIVCDGRQAGYSVGMTLIDFAQLFVDEGCSIAYNMDGGISTGMVFMGEHVNLHRSSRGGNSSSQRKWPDALLFGYSELVPSVDDPVFHTGNKNETVQDVQ